jgi:hypothetical protein
MITFLLLVALTVDLTKVKRVVAESKSAHTVTVDWKKVSQAKSYHLRLFEKNNEEWEQTRLITGITETKKRVRKLDPNTRYHVQVRAVHKTKRGPWSETLAVTTKVKTTKDDDTDQNCASDESPEFTADITDLTYVADIVPPPSLSGTVLKTHSFLNTELNLVPVYAPTDIELTAGAYYLESNEGGEYVLRFQLSCEVTMMLDHITDPRDEIREVFPDEPKDNTQDDTPTAKIYLEVGYLIGYTTGTQYGIWDFGVYNNTVSNDLVGNPNATDRDTTAVSI